MGGVKKGKSSSKSKSSKSSKDSKPKDLKQAQPTQDEPTNQVPPQERVALVRPYWETLSHEQRVDLLTLDVEFLHQRAVEVTTKTQKQLEEAEAERSAAEARSKGGLEDLLVFRESDVHAAIAEPQNLAEVLEEGVGRLREKSTWKVWQWPAGGQEFFDAESFRQCVEEHIDEELRAVLPKEEGRPVEKPAEAALRQRMCELLQKVHANTRQLQDDMMYPRRPTRGQRATSDQIHAAVRDTNVELITTMLEALEQEHEYLYHAVLYPITSFVCEMLPEKVRESTPRELFFEDLDRLAPEDVARICEWLTEKVDSFSAKIKPEAKEVEEEEEEEGIGDVDLFTLTSDKDKLTVNSKWQQHLQERLLGEDGHPRKVQEHEDPHSMGLVLEWVYGTIVSTAEKARDGAKRSLGFRPPSAQQAYDQLSAALQDQLNWETRAKQAKELLNEMLESRREARQLAEHHDTRPVPMPVSTSLNPAAAEAMELPDSVILEMLRREVLLTKAKLHALTHEHILGERKLRTLKSQLRQGEPEFDRLKRELEDVKNQPRGLEGTFRTAAEMERQRAQLADAAIEEQLEVQTAFREHGARLQNIYDRRQRTEIEMARREQEIKQLQGWRQTVQQLVDRFKESFVPIDENADLTWPSFESADFDAMNRDDRQRAEAHKLAMAAQDASQNPAQLVKLRQHFQKDVRRQLYNDEDDRTFFGWIQSELRSVEKRLEEGRATLQHLEMHLINVACDDPGATIGAQLALPMLQDRLDSKAREFADRRATEAELLIFQMEAEKEQRAKLDREKRLKAKQKVKDRVRTEKERLASEKEAREKAQLEALAESDRKRREQDELDRQKRLEEAQKAREEAEKLMMARREELMKDKDGHWSRRMAQESAASLGLQPGQAAAAVAEVYNQLVAEEANAARSSADEAAPPGGKSSSQATVSESDSEHLPRDTQANGYVKVYRRSGEQDGDRRRPGPIHKPEERTADGFNRYNRSRDNFGRPYPKSNFDRSGRRDGSLDGVRKHKDRDGEQEQARVLTLVRPKLNSGGSARPAPLRVVSGPDSSSSRSASPALVKSAEPHTPATPARQSSLQTPAFARSEHLANGNLPARPAPVPEATAADPGTTVPVVAQAPPESSTLAEPALPNGVVSPDEVDHVGLFERQVQVEEYTQPAAGVAAEVPHASLQLEEPAAQADTGPQPVPLPFFARPQPAAFHTGQQQHVEQHDAAPAVHGLLHGSHHQSQTEQHYSGGQQILHQPHEQVQHLDLPQQLSQQSLPVLPHQHLHHQQQHSAPSHPSRTSPVHHQHPAPQQPVPQPHEVQHAAHALQQQQHQQQQQHSIPQQLLQHTPQRQQHQSQGSSIPGMHQVAQQQGQYPGGYAPPVFYQRQNMPEGSSPLVQPRYSPHMNGGHHVVNPSLPQGGPQQAHSMMMPQAAFPGSPSAQYMQAFMVPGPNGMPQMVQMRPPSVGTSTPPHMAHAQMVPHQASSPPAYPSYTSLPSHSHPMHGMPAQPLHPHTHPAGLRRPETIHHHHQAHQPQQPPHMLPYHQQQPSQQQQQQMPLQQSLQQSPQHLLQQQPQHQQQQHHHQQARQMLQQPQQHVPQHQPQQQQQQPLLQQQLHSQFPRGIGNGSMGTPQPHIPAVPTQSPMLSKAPSAALSVSSSGVLSSATSLKLAGSTQLRASAPSFVPGGLRLGTSSSSGVAAAAASAQAAPLQPSTPTPSQTHPRLVQPPVADVAEAAKSAFSQSRPKPEEFAPQANSRIEQPAGPSAGIPSAAPSTTQPAIESQLDAAAASTPAGPGTPAAQSNDQSVASNLSPPGGVYVSTSQPAQDELGTDPAGPSQAGLLERQNSGTSASTSAPDAAVLGDKRKSPRRDGPPREGSQDDLKRLKLVRGLSNASGEYNCFLNAIIQTLWHLRTFRRGLLGLDLDALQAQGAIPEDLRVLMALSQIFHAFVQEGEAAQRPLDGDESEGARQTSISPAELREALSAMDKGKAAKQFELSDMHDASEVLDEIFNCLHRAELGSGASSALDPQLPQRTRIRVAPATSGSSETPGPAVSRPERTLIQDVFGLEVQVAAGDETEGSSPSAGSRPGADGSTDQWRQSMSRSRLQASKQQQAALQAQQAAQVGARKLKDSGLMEVLQFTKYFHLVPSQGLRFSSQQLREKGGFEERLRLATDADPASARSSSVHVPVNTQQPLTRLLVAPQVFNLAIVWESAHASAEAISGTMATIGTGLKLSGVFRGAPTSPTYQLQCVVCYFGHHYLSFALSEELNQWLLFDDTQIALVGDWNKVASAIVARCLQPSVLCYEKASS
ncbi:hypothetical protein WJX74_001758 [Apatococcus lobatus]|uniref:USP domain-containing protein n=1 Tax=Apatococcus lobatus TaxID=904363 RepID=A0AAW1S676_9CHLO